MNLETLWLVLGILFLHWIADFVLQTDKMARGKSKNWSDLLDHTLAYSGIMFYGLFLLKVFLNIESLSSEQIIFFYFITFACHTATDYFTSRLNSKLWAKEKVHNFFVSVGFDQWLHYAQLFGTYYLLTK